MKKISTILTLACASCAAFAQSLVQVYSDGKLFYPQNFFTTNGATVVNASGVFQSPLAGTLYAQNFQTLVGADITAKFKSNLSVFVDTYRDGIENSAYRGQGYGQYWTDCELKVLDKDGNIIYFFSTIYYNSSQVRALHPNVCDDDAVVYYYVSGDNTNGVCVKPKKLFTNRNSSIGAVEGASYGSSAPADNKVRITAIQIYPSAAFRDVFLNPENSIMVWRQSPSFAERDGKYGKLWRPAIIQFIR